MAWEISITAEGWQEIHDTLETWTKERLTLAIVCDDVQTFVKTFDPSIERSWQYESDQTTRYNACAHDTLVDEAYSRVEKNNTCDNGGNGYYVDAEGYYQVYVNDTNEEEE